MIILLVLLGLLVSGIVLMHYTYRWDELGCAFTILAAAGLCMALVAMPFSYYGTKAGVREFQSVKRSVVLSVMDSPFAITERATLINKVIESNEWLARIQYWNSTLFDIWIPDEVIDLQPIQ